ncbi:putative galacturan 1,4-alpha-galacturonidase C [Lachnellula cervina]|uniref:galacturonan 1,4-alpha-galacturonidase n=1 Tax=Lachnellula cervina TaxID=1316786 RepID=A0A7D8UTR0_9HELO|nr:putative galacturan 1,4-alpha-galacturonidase C [Lachnellula cervina]
MKYITTLSLVFTFITSTLSSPWGPSPKGPVNPGKTCTVQALGNQVDDTPQILKAFEECNNGGIVVFPEDQNYWIGTKLNLVIQDITIEWKGTYQTISTTGETTHTQLLFKTTTRASSSAETAFISMDTEPVASTEMETPGTTLSKPLPNQGDQCHLYFGTPATFLSKTAFFVKDSPLWALNIMNGTNMWFDHITCNSTALNAPYGKNWVQNTDGFDTMDANNIALTNMWYQGGDDCIAIKPRSYNIYVQNITCHGGNGIAIGSLGQYLEDSSVENVTVKDANIISYNNDMHNSAYIKTYMGALVPQSGYESAGLPRGGGWGVVRNILFQNFKIRGAGIGPNINQDSGNNGSFSGTSKMLVSGVRFVDFEGYMVGAKGNRTAV